MLISLIKTYKLYKRDMRMRSFTSVKISYNTKNMCKKLEIFMFRKIY